MSTKKALKEKARMLAHDGWLRTNSMMSLFNWARSTLTYHEKEFDIFQPGGPHCQKRFELQSVIDYIDDQCVEE